MQKRNPHSHPSRHGLSDDHYRRQDEAQRRDIDRQLREEREAVRRNIERALRRKEQRP